MASHKEMKVTHEEMAKEQVPLGYRDFCAHLLIPLNRCRRENFFLPFRCEHERHTYEQCEYDDYKRRVREYLKKKEPLQDDKFQWRSDSGKDY